MTIEPNDEAIARALYDALDESDVQGHQSVFRVTHAVRFDGWIDLIAVARGFLLRLEEGNKRGADGDEQPPA